MAIEPERQCNSECIGQEECPQDATDPERDATAKRAIQPFLGVVKDLKVLILANGRPDGHTWPTGIVFRRLGQAELLFE